MKKKSIVRFGIIVIAAIAISVFGVFAAKSFTQDADADRESKISAMKAERSEEETAGITADEETSAQQAEIGNSSQKKNEQKSKETSSKQAGTQAKKQESASGAASGTSKSTTSGKTEAPKNKEPVKTESKPAHVHDWQAVYQTVNKEVYGIKCNGCSFVTTDAGSLYAHIDTDPFDNCGSYSTGVVIRVEQENVLAGYKCSCGATK